MHSRFASHIGLLLTLLSSLALAYKPAKTCKTDALAGAARSHLADYVGQNGNNGTCTMKNAMRRREWYASSLTTLGKEKKKEKTQN